MTGSLRALWLSGVAALMLVLSGCGFTPLYGETATAGLSRVVVETPDTRLGYRLRERLEESERLKREAKQRFTREKIRVRAEVRGRAGVRERAAGSQCTHARAPARVGDGSTLWFSESTRRGRRCWRTR